MIDQPRDPIAYEVSKWHHNNPDAPRFPGHISNYVDILERRHLAETAAIRISIDPYQLEEIRVDLADQAEGWKAHREAEEQLAQYIRDVYDATGWQPPAPKGSIRGRSLLELAEDLEGCRRAGAVGLKPDGGTMIAWESKCGQVHLCPDESREETQRLTEFYLPAMLDWVKEKPTHRLFYAVFTDHNFRPGQLFNGKNYLFEKFSEWRKYRPHACPVRFVERHGCNEVVRSRRQYLDAPYTLEGALVVQEDPLSAHGDWNVHLNAFLMVDGQFDYKTARDVWGGNVHFQEIDGDPAAIRRALLEAIKYSAQIVPSKSEEKRHQTEAPAMTEWEPRQWIEWWSAQQGFRRVRSYGALYALHGKRWDAMEPRARVDLCRAAEIASEAAGKPWKELAEEEKNPIRRAMVHGERLDMSLVEWIGTVKAGTDGSLWVDLIPGNNFSGSKQMRGTSQPLSSGFATGPPGPYH